MYYGINTNYDSTATSQGVPQTDHHLTRHEELEAAANNDPTETEQHGHGKVESADRSIDKDEDCSVASEPLHGSSAVQALARSYSRGSVAGAGAGAGTGTGDAATGPIQNPFFADKDSCLNPHSPNFSARAWAKALVELVSRDGVSLRSSGVCFQNLNVHGFGAATDYQKDVANVWLSAAAAVRQLTGGGKQRIDILRSFDGLVRKGEMLVVLGPPGSGCSTFLKTIAGEMNGIYTGDGSYFNYQ
ncbi:hypothetical protein E4U54_004427, partial [Claviceps lovelessii]